MVALLPEWGCSEIRGQPALPAVAGSGEGAMWLASLGSRPCAPPGWMLGAGRHRKNADQTSRLRGAAQAPNHPCSYTFVLRLIRSSALNSVAGSPGYRGEPSSVRQTQGRARLEGLAGAQPGAPACSGVRGAGRGDCTAERCT